MKWNFTTPREEFVEQLREQMLNAGINKMLITNMFHSDFRYHLKAIETLLEVFSKQFLKYSQIYLFIVFFTKLLGLEYSG